MNNIPDGFWDGVAGAIQTPQGTLSLIVLLVFLAMTYLFARSVKRYRDEIGRRIAECEDAHLERDKIQLGAVTLIVAMLGVMTEFAGKDKKRLRLVKEYTGKADLLVKQVNDLNNDILKRRELERKQMKSEKI